MELTKIQNVLERSLNEYNVTSPDYPLEVIVAFVTVDLIRALHDLSSPTQTQVSKPITVVTSPKSHSRRQTTSVQPSVMTSVQHPSLVTKLAEGEEHDRQNQE